ncbi:uncharacterized protein LOC121751947 isoform X1 [Salvia splendens]|uniref:uncharacterized protein LOC121751947 isoform X1 n=1 Tax=Salvia splendens TaxID=180675 RepID=UPI001C256734|nr:uncharacterized protein LOC121751947 isoform X1 [Salvia splendens]
MEVDFYWRSHVPPFGSWDCNNDDLPFTQCFESARQAALLRYSYSEDRDLYVAGDLYDNEVLTPAVIVVPRRRGKAVYPRERGGKNQKDAWAECDCDLSSSPSPAPRRQIPKAVDEDLYKISPHLLRQQAKKKKGWGFFSCLRPCVN